MTSPTVLIAGAGIGGLTTATILAQNGGTVHVFERAKKFDDIGAGIQQSPNAMKVHQAIGIETTLERYAFEPEAIIFRKWKNGKAELTTPLKPDCEDRYGAKYLHIHRAALHSALLEAAKAAKVKIHMEHKVTAYSQSQNSVSVVINGQEFSGDCLIGADGIHSNIRQQFMGNIHPKFTGQVAWRGTVEADRLPQNLLAPAANNWLGNGKHFVAYYVRGGELINFVAVEERDRWTEDSWSQTGDMDELRRAFAGWDKPVTDILAACETCFLWGLFDQPPLSRWTDRRVTLLGDAAHPMLPFVAQGSAMTIEDAWVIAQKLLTSNDIPDALQDYQNTRQPRTAMIQNLSRANADLYHMKPGPKRSWRRFKFAVASHMPSLAYGQLDKIFAEDVVKDYPISLE